MPKSREVHTIITPAQTPVFSKHFYNEIYGGSAGCSVVINGKNMAIGPSSRVTVAVRSISGGVGCFLLGNNLDVYEGSPYLGSYSIPDVVNDTINEFVVDDYIGDYFV